MKVITRKRSATVQASTAKAFDKKFNELSDQMQEDVELVWDNAPMTVHFIYSETVKVPETLVEKFELDGMGRHCIDCQHFKKGANGRCRSMGCELRDGQKDFSPACELYYQELMAGKQKTLGGEK